MRQLEQRVVATRTLAIWPATHARPDGVRISKH